MLLYLTQYLGIYLKMTNTLGHIKEKKTTPSIQQWPTNSHFSPLRYPGGKAKLTGYIAELLKLNCLQKKTYIEPFCGGAGIGLSLLANGHISHLHLNDYDRAIYAFWHSVIFNNEKLCRMVANTEINLQIWKRQKEILATKATTDLLDLGFATFFLNRTNRSGILGGGMIGGHKQTGNWKLDARFNKENLLKRIALIGQLSEHITITNCEAREYIKQKLPFLPSKALIYFDPPYFQKGASLYMNAFQKNDHVLLAEAIQKEVKQNWVVSYDNTLEIVDLYKKCPQESFSLSYSAQNHYTGSEVMIFKNGLKKPLRIFTERKCINLRNDA